MNKEPKETRQVRIALVLYGGVSLAVYENGVTRCFYDLVRSQGIFKILLQLLDASAVVDVIAGTSAGGINGLMLAVALESGQKFDSLTKLWRRLGDLGILMRNAGEANNAESLLDGELFNDELIKCFQDLCRVENKNYESPGEMDVFITGTELDGHLRRYRDSLGKEIEDKEHRVVFHLRHRPGRKSLGIAEAKNKVDSDIQAKILGTIARITASFPMAFSPVKGRSLDENVYKALEAVASVEGMNERFFVDGGVLDNKPFGPVLRAIFYRMPENIVDRRLFYVEPDPVPFADKPKPDHPPVAIGFASLTSIPGHEGIAEDLECLLEHNERVRWLAMLKKEIVEQSAGHFGCLPTFTPTYFSTRIESLARSIVIDCDGVPSVKDFPKDFRSTELLADLRSSLRNLFQNNPTALDHYDIAFHMRRSFELLYEYYSDLTRNPDSEKTKKILFFLGRIIKTLKTILDHMLGLRERLMSVHDGKAPPTADVILDRFKNFLGAEAPWWKTIREDIKREKVKSRFAGSFKDFLVKDALTALASELKSIKVESLRENGAGETILQEIAAATQAILAADDSGRNRFSLFPMIDEKLYPLMFTSGLYELDEVEFVRISPADAQIGLARNDSHVKVAGDELAHFSAFLRRDWRSNDILQGRFDGICQIICSLLDDGALARVLSQSAREEMFLPETINKWLPRCPTIHLDNLYESWKALIVQYRHLSDPKKWDDKTVDAARHFREQLILVGQQDALQEDLGTILTDLHYQEIKFGRSRGLRGLTPGANETSIENDAKEAAEQDMKNLPPEDRAGKYREMRLGSQGMIGPNGQIPNAVVGEYGALAVSVRPTHLSLGGLSAILCSRLERF